MEIPCKNCLLLPMCRNKVKKSHIPIHALMQGCQLLFNYCEEFDKRIKRGKLNPKRIFDPELKKIIYKGHPFYGDKLLAKVVRHSEFENE